MKNQYTGDIGDYTKIGLLRAIESAGLTVGVNWYLTPNDGETDGNHMKYLFSISDLPGRELYDIFKDIVQTDLRSVGELEKRKLLKNAVYFSEPLVFSNSKEKTVSQFMAQKSFGCIEVAGCDFSRS